MILRAWRQMDMPMRASIDQPPKTMSIEQFMKLAVNKQPNWFDEVSLRSTPPFRPGYSNNWQPRNSYPASAPYVQQRQQYGPYPSQQQRFQPQQRPQQLRPQQPQRPQSQQRPQHQQRWNRPLRQVDANPRTPIPDNKAQRWTPNPQPGRVNNRYTTAYVSNPETDMQQNHDNAYSDAFQEGYEYAMSHSSNPKSGNGNRFKRRLQDHESLTQVTQAATPVEDDSIDHVIAVPVPVDAPENMITMARIETLKASQNDDSRVENVSQGMIIANPRGS